MSVLLALLLAPPFGSAGAVDGPPRIAVWYGDVQRFGHLGGHPQRWANVPGSVSPAERIASLSYRLNGGGERPLSFREDRKRIAADGDFNVELARGDLYAGANALTIRAVASSGRSTERAVTVEYDPDPAGWPLPYAIDWSAVTNLTDAVQPVDGRWELVPGGVRTRGRYYDRALAIGDGSWRDYEVRTTVAVHAVTGPGEGANDTGVAHAAIALRWPGHDADGLQPSVKWWPLGATAEFRLGRDLSACRWRIFDGRREFHRESPRRRPLAFDTPYRMVHRVESLPDGTNRYRAKLWPAGSPEPAGWDLTRLEPREGTSRPGRPC